MSTHAPNPATRSHGHEALCEQLAERLEKEKFDIRSAVICCASCDGNGPVPPMAPSRPLPPPAMAVKWQPPHGSVVGSLVFIRWISWLSNGKTKEDQKSLSKPLGRRGHLGSWGLSFDFSFFGRKVQGPSRDHEGCSKRRTRGASPGLFACNRWNPFPCGDSGI